MKSKKGCMPEEKKTLASGENEGGRTSSARQAVYLKQRRMRKGTAGRAEPRVGRADAKRRKKRLISSMKSNVPFPTVSAGGDWQTLPAARQCAPQKREKSQGEKRDRKEGRPNPIDFCKERELTSIKRSPRKKNLRQRGTALWKSGGGLRKGLLLSMDNRFHRLKRESPCRGGKRVIGGRGEVEKTVSMIGPKRRHYAVQKRPRPARRGKRGGEFPKAQDHIRAVVLAKREAPLHISSGEKVI